MIEQAFEASTKSFPDSAAKKDGIAIGEKCAAAVIADRASDGTNVPDTYRPITSPGVWIPTTPPLFAEYARAKPWVMKSADQIRPAPPPDLKSELYARDYNETKDMGGAKSTKRTRRADRGRQVLDTARISGRRGRTAARQLSAAKKLSLAENARLFALLNMGIANTFITDWDAKFTYNFWRPVTAIRNGDQDGNDATERDAGWTPLNATPMHPEYPSQAAIIAGVSHGRLRSGVRCQPVDAGGRQRRDRSQGPAPLRQREADWRTKCRTCASGAASTSATRSMSATPWAGRSPSSWSTIRSSPRIDLCGSSSPPSPAVASRSPSGRARKATMRCGRALRRRFGSSRSSCDRLPAGRPRRSDGVDACRALFTRLTAAAEPGQHPAVGPAASDGRARA